jgi:hypothetical protein
MIKAIVKVEKKIEKGKKFTKTPQAIYLIPEFMILTGMGNEQRENHHTMQEVAEYTKTAPLEKKRRIDELSKKINNSQVQIQSMAKMEGYKLKIPFIRAKKDHPIDLNGSFDFRDIIREEKIFEQGRWALAYSSRTKT